MNFHFPDVPFVLVIKVRKKNVPLLCKPDHFEHDFIFILIKADHDPPGVIPVKNPFQSARVIRMRMRNENDVKRIHMFLFKQFQHCRCLLLRSAVHKPGFIAEADHEGVTFRNLRKRDFQKPAVLRKRKLCLRMMNLIHHRSIPCRCGNKKNPRQHHANQSFQNQ